MGPIPCKDCAGVAVVRHFFELAAPLALRLAAHRFRGFV
jgi:hypothetical protein